MSDFKMFFSSPTLFILVDCSILLSLGLAPLPISSSPQQISHNFASLTSWVLQGKPGFNSTASCNGLSSPPFRDTLDTCLASPVFLNLRGKFYNLFLLSLTLKPKPCGQSCQVLHLTMAGSSPSCSITSLLIFYPSLQLHRGQTRSRVSSEGWSQINMVLGHQHGFRWQQKPWNSSCLLSFWWYHMPWTLTQTLAKEGPWTLGPQLHPRPRHPHGRPDNSHPNDPWWQPRPQLST